MPATALSENYCVCVGEDGAPREIGRSGTAVTYKAMGYQSGQPVSLQLIPLGSFSEDGRAQFEVKARAVRKLKHPNIARLFDVRVEGDHIVFATEYLQGETAEAWVVAHGPMPRNAVVRVGLQVVSALAEAAFHSLSHRSIQPSNLMIVSGAVPDGNWPSVKLLNFGLAGLKLYVEGQDELVPPIGAAFASPEQQEKGKVDFRSEIFSLGATMCFLLTGAVPLTGRARRSGAGERVLPSSRAIPRALRKLLRRMLRINPDERPHDPLLLTDELRKCLGKVERRPALIRSLPVPLEPEPSYAVPRIRTVTPSPLPVPPEPEPSFAASRVRTATPSPLPVPPEPEPAFAPSDRPRLLVPILTGATLLLLCGALGAVLLPGQFRWWTHSNRPIETIGVPIGVPENDFAPETEEFASKTVTNRNELLPPLPAPSSTPEASAKNTAPVIAESSPTATPAPEEAAIPPASTQQSPVQPIVVQEVSSPPPAETPVSAPPQVVVNNRMAEPPPPAEAPPSPATAPPPFADAAPQTIDEPAAVAEQEPPSEEQVPKVNVPAEVSPPPSSTPAKQIAAAPPKPASAASKSARANSIRRGNARPARNRALPPLRVGTTEARFVGTTDDGKWILRTASGDTVVTPPLPDTNDAPVISHRKVRKVQTPTRALPIDSRPPVVVLPPQN